jgi:hypothetical protein
MSANVLEADVGGQTLLKMSKAMRVFLAETDGVVQRLGNTLHFLPEGGQLAPPLARPPGPDLLIMRRSRQFGLGAGAKTGGELVFGTPFICRAF